MSSPAWNAVAAGDRVGAVAEAAGDRAGHRTDERAVAERGTVARPSGAARRCRSRLRLQRGVGLARAATTAGAERGVLACSALAAASRARCCCAASSSSCAFSSARRGARRVGDLLLRRRRPAAAPRAASCSLVDPTRVALALVATRAAGSACPRRARPSRRSSRAGRSCRRRRRAGTGSTALAAHVVARGAELLLRGVDLRLQDQRRRSRAGRPAACAARQPVVGGGRGAPRRRRATPSSRCRSACASTSCARADCSAALASLTCCWSSCCLSDCWPSGARRRGATVDEGQRARARRAGRSLRMDAHSVNNISHISNSSHSAPTSVLTHGPWRRSGAVLGERDGGADRPESGAEEAAEADAGADHADARAR